MWDCSLDQWEYCWCLSDVLWLWSSGRAHRFLQLCSCPGFLGTLIYCIALWFPLWPHETPPGLGLCVKVHIGHCILLQITSLSFPIFCLMRDSCVTFCLALYRGPCSTLIFRHCWCFRKTCRSYCHHIHTGFSYQSSQSNFQWSSQCPIPRQIPYDSTWGLFI